MTKDLSSRLIRLFDSNGVDELSLEDTHILDLKAKALTRGNPIQACQKRIVAARNFARIAEEIQIRWAVKDTYESNQKERAIGDNLRCAVFAYISAAMSAQYARLPAVEVRCRIEAHRLWQDILPYAKYLGGKIDPEREMRISRDEINRLFREKTLDELYFE